MSILEKDKFRVIDFEIQQMKYSTAYQLFAILENEVKGKKKYGRKMLATRRVLIRSELDSARAGTLLTFYKTQLEYRDDMERLVKALSKKDLEINEDMNDTFVDASTIYRLW